RFESSRSHASAWKPYESGTGPVAGGHDLCRVARPPRCELDLEVDARDTLDGVDHVQHRKTAPVAAIERPDRTCIRDYVHVSSPPTPMRRVVGTEHIYFRPPPERSTQP